MNLIHAVVQLHPHDNVSMIQLPPAFCTVGEAHVILSATHGPSSSAGYLVSFSARCGGHADDSFGSGTEPHAKTCASLVLRVNAERSRWKLQPATLRIFPATRFHGFSMARSPR